MTTSAGTVAIYALSALAIGALGMALLEKKTGIHENPAHEDFVGRRVELHPGHDLWMRGARYGKVTRVDGDVLVIKMDNSHVKKLIRVKKDRVTLI